MKKREMKPGRQGYPVLCLLLNSGIGEINSFCGSQ